MVDEVPDENFARYVVSIDTVSLVFYPRENDIVKKFGSEEILVPMTTENVNWDDELIKMLIESVNESDSSRNISAKNLDDWDAWTKIHSYFDGKDLRCTQVVVHPSRATTEVPLLNVHESELCPKNKAFFLPSPQFVGVLATRGNKQEFGMGIIYSEFVVCVNFEE